MQWYDTVFEIIDMRSFSNLWYWIVLAVIWSSASHWVLGVPYDMVERAKRKGGQAAQDLENLVKIYTNRILHIVHETGILGVALTSGFLTATGILGFLYNVEFAQALFLILFPMSLIGLLSVFTAQRIQRGENADQALWRRLRLHRLCTQVIGIVAIFVTSLWGVSFSLS